MNGPPPSSTWRRCADGGILATDPSDGRPYCPVHGKRFRPHGDGYQWHLDHFHDGRPSVSGSVLLLDDIITHGSSSEACRRLHLRDAGVPVVYGFLVGKTLRN